MIGRGQNRVRSELAALTYGTLSIADVCELTGRPHGSVRWSLHKAVRAGLARRVSRGWYKLTAAGKRRAA